MIIIDHEKYNIPLLKSRAFCSGGPLIQAPILELLQAVVPGPPSLMHYQKEIGRLTTP